MSEILTREEIERIAFVTCVPPYGAQLLSHDAALRLAIATAERERDAQVLAHRDTADDLFLTIAQRDSHWREVESLRERLDKMKQERDDARAALEKSRRTIYFTWRDVEACREALSLSADIKGDTLEEVVRFLLIERDALLARAHEDNAVCLCGCPLSEHEDNGEDGEQCEHEDHVCLRTCPAIRDLYQAARTRLAAALAKLGPVYAASLPAPPASAIPEAVLVVCPKCERSGDGACDECGGHGATVVHRDLKPENAATEAWASRYEDALMEIRENGHSLHATSCMAGLNPCCRCIARLALSSSPAPSTPHAPEGEEEEG